MKIRSKIAAVIVGTAALAGVANVAYAGSFNEDFDLVAPVWQNPVQTSAQTKALSNVDGSVNVSTVGGSYSTDVQQCHLISCGTKIYGLSGGDSADLPNSIAAGDVTRASFQISSFNAVSVQITGNWRSF